MTQEEALKIRRCNGVGYSYVDFIKALQTLEPDLPSTNYDQIDKRAEDSKKALDYMAEHPLTHDEAVEQTQRLKNNRRIEYGNKQNKIQFPSDMDKECIELCEVLNSLPTVQTFESCCGHLKDRFSIWFFCDNIGVLSCLGRATERNYSDGKWEVVVDSTDTHPYGVFWFRSKEPFSTYEEMNKSLQGLIDNINYWFKVM